MRQESRGGHWRSDFPVTASSGARSFLTLDQARRAPDMPQRQARP
jgi:aspartate oxidase